jgi:glutamyl-tRNA synthetase
MKDILEKHVLKNAIGYNGKANVNAVLGKVLAEHPEFKKDMKKVVGEIQKVVGVVSKLTVDEQRKKLMKIAPEMLEEKKEVFERKLEMQGAVKGKVVMRFAPSPSGPLHLGHAFVLGLNSELCKEYDGKLLLRIEDTNPENIYDKAYTMIPEDMRWLTKGNVADVIVQSDRLGIYYDCAEKLVAKGHAYVCTCSADKFKETISASKACACRGLPLKEQQKRYAKMFGEYKQGEAVLRLKTDVAHKNPAMRDFPLVRINDEKHPRTGTKHRVWPLMNFSVAVDDHELGVTHTLRGKDHMDNEKRQRMIAECFGWNVPVALYVGRINFTDIDLSTTGTKKLILEKKYNGWDDIRLPFMPALKRRGYQPEAFVKYALDVGVSPADKKVSKQEFFKIINHFNKEVLDPQANRYFFVANPVRVSVKGAPEREVYIHLHPDFHARGHRSFMTRQDFFISQKDFDALEEGKVHRLMDCLNFVREKKSFVYHSRDHDEFKKAANKGLIMHWLPADGEMVNVSVLLEDGTMVKGKGEHLISQLPEGAIVQFERFGFCRLDKKSKGNYEFWFTHK